MKIEFYREEERGYANYTWLQANYSFSFAGYHNPGKTNFGALRVLNDDIIQGGTGFGKHPHKNMEIITIPLEGALAHKDSMSEVWIPLKTGEVQVMSAGKGVMHAEKNNSETNFINLFQIWILPDKKNVEPAYNQMTFHAIDRKNKLQILVTSYAESKIKSLKIHQDARISRIDLSKDFDFKYEFMSENHGVYLMLISGEVSIENNKLKRRDAMGVYKTSSLSLHADQDAEILFIEVPMVF